MITVGFAVGAGAGFCCAATTPNAPVVSTTAAIAIRVMRIDTHPIASETIVRDPQLTRADSSQATPANAASATSMLEKHTAMARPVL